MNYGEGYSLSDIAAATGNGNNGNNGGWGENGSWWVIIFLIFAFMGWGRNGFGGNNGGSNDGSNGGSFAGYTLASDFATLQRQLSDGFSMLNNSVTTVNEGLCNGFYENARLTDGVNQNIASSTASLQNTLCQGFNGINTNLMTNGYETRLGIQNIGSQLADCCCGIKQQISDCCCTTQRGIDGINYNMAMNTNNIQNTLCNNTRDIIQAQTDGTRAVLDALTNFRLEDKNQQIQAQQNEINALRLSASQQAQNNYLINQLKPCPIPAFLTCNPYTGSYGYTNVGYNNGCGCNSGCGCGSF